MTEPEMMDEVSPVIQQRKSSKLYHPDKYLEENDIRSLLEAARWAPSSGNGQPWRYILFPKDQPETFLKGWACLDEGNQVWAQYASLLILAVAQEIRPNGKINKKALHDLGLANENLLLQAIHLGLKCRPMGGFDAEKAKKDFLIPDGYIPVVMIAVGLPGEADDLPEEILDSSQKQRSRNPIEAFAFNGSWEHPLGSHE